MPPLPHKTSPPTPQVVEEIFTREGQLFELVVAGRVLRTTPEHPFFVEGQGWTPAGELQPGNLLSTATGEWLPVESVTNTHQSVPVYNFRVSNYHTYFIAPRDAAFDVWVHNTYLNQQRRLTQLTQQTRNELLGNDQLPRNTLTPNEINAIVQEPWRMRVFFGTAVDRRVKTMAHTDDILADLTVMRGNAPQDFLSATGFGFDVTGGSRTSILSHYRRPGVDAVVTYDSIPANFGYEWVNRVFK